ncbi:unnamed protein product [Spirodela intermedia]|uniref:J domain-containing protein n=1 Tax=Spirodela intermedia TaxID=51605 RepID=A0A7I8IVY3_SPIIN|nr:unnamed protein product [Spirodela intermedia]CAA6661733.1 unnamed protein product [Spirodela intermedia]
MTGISLNSPPLPLSAPPPLPSRRHHSRFYLLRHRHHRPDACKCERQPSPSLLASPCVPLRALRGFGVGGRRRGEGVAMASARAGGNRLMRFSGAVVGDPQEIKRAYRKLALKFHPDVNKEANAQEKFMRIKHAYNSLINSDSQFRTNFGGSKSDYAGSTFGKNWNRKPEEAEEFYGFGDFFRDLQTEYENWEASARSQEKPKSLWRNWRCHSFFFFFHFTCFNSTLRSQDIGEEFVEFLEKELSISDLDPAAEDGGMEGSSFRDQSQRPGAQKPGEDAQSSIEENIDEIEAALSRLKKELGL